MINIERAAAIDGWMNIGELSWLMGVAQTSGLIIEVGCYKGRSTRVLCDNSPGSVIAIDPWNGPFIREDGSTEFVADDNLMEEFKRNLTDCKNLTVFRGTLQEFVETSLLTIVPNFIFIDGCHLYDCVKKDIFSALKIIKQGGLLAFHDYEQSAWPGVKRAVNEFFPKVNIYESIGWVQL